MGPVHHLTQAITIGLGQDGVILEALDHLQEVSGSQPLQPEGGSLPRPHPRQEQRPLGIHAELSTEEGGAGKLLQQALAGLLRGKLSYHIQRGIHIRLGEAEDKAFVVGQHLHVHPCPLSQHPGQGQSPGAIDLAPEGGMHHQPWIAQRVGEALHDDRSVGGDGADGVELAADILQHVAGRVAIQGIVPLQPLYKLLRGSFLPSFRNSTACCALARG